MKNYEELDFTDDFLFCKIMTMNEDICIELTELITGRKISRIVRPESQKTVQVSPDGKGVRFDVYFTDQSDVIYDIEMQTVKTSNLPKHSRYYQGMIDLNSIRPGEDYNRLTESFVIFICPFDAFGRGLHRYSFEYLCIQDSRIGLGDGAKKVFLCAGGDADDVSAELSSFLDFISGRNASGALVDRLREEVEKARKHDEWKVEYMTLEMKYFEKLEEGRLKGLEEGRQEGRRETLTALVKSNLLSKTDAAAAAGVSEQEFETWLEAVKEN